MIAGCAKPVYIQVPESERLVIFQKGDKLIRSGIEPKEVELPWDGEALSDVELHRLRKIEEKLVINGAVGLGIVGTTEAE